MDNYIIWLNDLTEKINQNKIWDITAKVYNKSIVITNNMQQKTLAISNTSLEKYYKTIAMPIYTYEQSIKDAYKRILEYISDWI